MMRITLMISALCFCACAQKNLPNQWTLFSPNRTLALTVKWLQTNSSPSEIELGYSVTLVANSQPVLLDSPLGLDREDQDFSTGLVFQSASSVRTIDDTYTMTTRKQRILRSHCCEQTLTFHNRHGQPLQLVLRAFDDGVAFRYCFPNTDSELRVIREERTGFHLPTEALAFIQPYDEVTTYTPAYEAYYENGIPVGTPSPNKMGWCFPALFRLPGAWVAITEAGLDETYCGCRLAQEAEGGLYRLRFPDSAEGNATGEVHPRSPLPWSTPWRVILVGKELNRIVESSLVHHLSPPSVLTDTDWIKPGRVAWSWWSDPPSPKNMQAQRRFIDLAAEMNWEYCLVDANWNEMPPAAIPELVAYGKRKGVALLLWYNSGGPHNSVTEAPRDRMYDRPRRRQEMQWLRDIGVKGIKVDFFQSDKQNVIRQYLDILKDAAEFHIMVNFHGCTLPRGWQRTFPHLISMEAVRGCENYLADAAYPAAAPWHNTILVFTRNVVGSMDYTPVAFNDSRFAHLTTWGYELALSVVFESSWLHFADQPAAYLQQPAAVKSFLRDLPTVWDETRLLGGEPGKSVLIARRHGDDWYFGAINGQSSAQKLTWSFSMLSADRYAAVKIFDGSGPRQLIDESHFVQKNDQSVIVLPPFGGMVLQLKKSDL